MDAHDSDQQQAFVSGWRLSHGNSFSQLSTEGEAAVSSITRPRLLNKRDQHIKSIDRFGVSWYERLLYYSGDLFHTLLNMPRGRFVTIFFTIYIVEYMLFALLYLWQPDECVPNVERFSTALWFSVQTAATIGYGNPLAPNPSCTLVNLLVMFQVISSSLVDYAMMGLMFARFSAPSKRSSSLRFSKVAVLQRHASGHFCLAVRVANMRKHVMIRPVIQMLLARPDNPGQSAFEFQELQLEDAVSYAANLRLGLAVTLMHVIRPGSPLWGLSVDDLLLMEMEVMVFFEGVDAMTSNSVQARYSYYAADMRMNERFATLYMVYKGQKLGLDFSTFDDTQTLGSSEENAMMRRQRFCELTEISSTGQHATAGIAAGTVQCWPDPQQAALAQHRQQELQPAQQQWLTSHNQQPQLPQQLPQQHSAGPGAARRHSTGLTGIELT